MIEKFKSKIALKITGKNINRFIKRLTTKKIDILSLKYLNKNTAKIIIYKKDYEEVLKIKSIYEIFEEEVFGYLKIQKALKINKHLIIFLIIGYLFFLVLTNTIFSIEVIHSNKDIRNLIKEELQKNGITKYTLKKDYQTLNKIKEKILNNHPDKIEWLEIETVGTKYIVRVEEREIVKQNDNNRPRHIVAKKDAVIKKTIANKGDIICNTDDYVKKGDIIVNGEIMLEDKSMGKVKAEGQVYGEVWYVTKTEYPFVYHEEKATGKAQNNYTIKFLNRDIELSLKKYKNKKVEETTILSHPLLPIKLVYQKQKEIQVISQVLTFDEALLKAEDYATKKIQKNLRQDEYIIRSKYLKSTVRASTIEVEMFFAVYENITAYREIE